MIDAGTDAENLAVDEARGLLAVNERFTAADKKFTSALGSLARRDTDQYPEAARDAVSTFEDVCRKLLSDEKVTLPEALDELGRRTRIHRTLIDAMKKLYAYRGDVPGAAHRRGSGERARSQIRDSRMRSGHRRDHPEYGHARRGASD